MELRFGWKTAVLAALLATPSFHALAAQQPAGSGADAAGGAQSYPNRPVRVINPFAPGGGADTVAHMIAQRLFSRWPHSFVIDNRGGAGGAIGTDLAARATPDGYTLAMATASTIVINPLVREVPFEPLRDFEPVIETSTVPLILVVHPSVPAKSAKDFIALAKSQPGKLNFSSSGDGTISHLAGELFKVVTGADIVHVPFRGGGPARNALLGAQVQASFQNLLGAASQVKAGKLRALGVTSAKRARGVPEVPTLAEGGLPGYEVVQWNGIIAPRGTPKAIIAKLNSEINAILALPDIEKILVNSGAEPAGGTPEQFWTFVKAEIEKWRKVIRDAKLKKQ